MRKFKILVVDDDINIPKLLKVNLEKCGYDVVTAFNGKDGFEKFKTEKPDLIIADIMIPGIDGYHFCWNILYEDGLYVSPTPKIIILTVRDKKLDGDISEKIGVDAYITKPFDIKFVVGKVKELLLK
ncbi:MAG: response regulator [Elusimicrobiota bacterium]